MLARLINRPVRAAGMMIQVALVNHLAIRVVILVQVLIHLNRVVIIIDVTYVNSLSLWMIIKISNRHVQLVMPMFKRPVQSLLTRSLLLHLQVHLVQLQILSVHPINWPPMKQNKSLLVILLVLLHRQVSPAIPHLNSRVNFSSRNNSSRNSNNNNNNNRLPHRMKVHP